MLKHATKKPLGGEELPAFFNCRASEIVIIGDRLTTDIVYGRLIGAFTILCRKIVTEQGDNLMAKYLRRIEHYYLGLAINHGVPLPKHFKQ